MNDNNLRAWRDSIDDDGTELLEEVQAELDACPSVVGERIVAVITVVAIFAVIAYVTQGGAA